MRTIKLLVMDVDGTLTDGKVYIGGNGEEMKAFDIKDGLGIVKLASYGIVPAIITGRNSTIVERRAKELGIQEVYQGIHDKINILNSLAEKYCCGLENVAYIGDDENDLAAIALCGITACPGDGVDAVKKQVDFVCSKHGGCGAVREFIEYLLS